MRTQPVLRARFLVIVAAMLVAGAGCRRRTPPFAGEWVLDGQVDGKGVFTPLPHGRERMALRFDPPRTVSAGKYDTATGTLVPGSVSTAPYLVKEDDDGGDVVQFGMFGSQVVDGHLMLAYPGQGGLRLSRPAGARLFPKVRLITAQELAAQLDAARSRFPDEDADVLEEEEDGSDAP